MLLSWDAPESLKNGKYLLTVGIFAIFTTLISRPVIARLLRFNSGRIFWLKLGLLSLCVLGCILPILFGLFNPYLINRQSDSLFDTVLGFALLFLSTLLSIFFACILAILMARVVAYAGAILLFVGEFVVRRIAEYPKGQILAVSAFFGGIIALIKAFG